MLADWRAAPVPERVRAALSLLEAMTLRPDELTAADVQPLLDAGVSEEGVVDALYVGLMFNLIDRIADSMGFLAVSEKEYGKSADRLLRYGHL